MSIKSIARDLYRLQNEVASLEKKLTAAPLARRIRIEELLRKARAEKEYLQRALDGKLGR